jgi:two-component system sensor histidine kinase BaeS
MLQTLRGRFIVSHVLPLLVVVPLMGLALIYVLETRVVLPNLVDELSGEAALLALLAQNQPRIWSDAGDAQRFVRQAARHVDDRVMLLTPEGRLLASSDPADAARVGQPITHPGLASAAAGATDVRTFHQRRPSVEVVDVLEPVTRGGVVTGIIRVTLRLGTVIDEFLQRRYLIAGIMAAGALLGSAIGWVLAVNLGRPLQQVTLSVAELAEGERWQPLPEPRLEEMAALVRAFNTLVVRLRSMEDARRQLLANLVHELGRPLGALRSAVQALQRGAGEQPGLRVELLNGIDDEIRRMGRLVDDLAQVHGRVLGPLELRRQEVFVPEWLPHVLAPWAAAAARKGLRWEVSVPSDIPAVKIDPDRLGQAVGNLISNAIKFAPQGGTVSVAAGLADHELWIRVEDTGPGIPPDERKRIFESFYRGAAGRRFPQGMGLGLAIARDLVAAHAGTIEVDGGRGARLTIRVPLHFS